MGLEPVYAPSHRIEKLIESPSHAVGLERLEASFQMAGVSWSPSHTVGSEQSRFLTILSLLMVSIPHGGLGTSESFYHTYPLIWSPSHTVGSEPPPAWGPLVFLQLSPSHTVGSELGAEFPHSHQDIGLHPTRWARNKLVPHSCVDFSVVSIPHGGLGTKGVYLVFGILRRSPSHTVGLERNRLS